MRCRSCLIISNPIPETNLSPKVTLEKFSRVISSVFSSVSVVCGNVGSLRLEKNARLVKIECDRTEPKLKRVLSFALYEFSVGLKVLRADKHTDAAFFWIADKMLVPFLCARLKGIPVYYMIAGNVEKEGTGRRLGGRVIAFMAEHASYVFAESQSVFDEWDLSIAPERRLCLHLYIEPGFTCCGVQRIKRIGMLCRLAPGKHVFEAICAVAHYNCTHTETLTLQVVGDGPQAGELDDLVSELAVEDAVELVGWVDHSETGSFVESWDLLLFPTDAEGLPNAPLEAMSTGVPVMASAVGGLKDLVEDGVNGWFLRGTDSTSIEQGIERAANLPSEKIASISRAARETVIEKYSFRAAVDNALGVLKGEL